MASDNSMSLLPGSNPTGGPKYGSEGFVPGAGTSSGSNPMLLPPNLPASAPPANPYAGTVVPPSGAPAFGANSGPYSSTSLFTTGSGGTGNPVSGVGDITGRQGGRTLGELQTMYGEGLGALMYQFLQSGAGFNQNAINNIFAALQPGINRGEEDLMSQFSASGNRFSSGAQIGLGDYLSQVNLNEGQIESQMYEQAVSKYMDVLNGVSSQNLQLKEFNMSQPGIFDDIISAVGALNPFKSMPQSSSSSSAPSVPAIPTAGGTGGADTSIPELPSGYTPPSAITPQNQSLLDVIAGLTGGGSFDTSGASGIPVI